jgi:bifunctional UDP-N-acetylglucosamine pyrophosphorylase/glucosamine-1-phosphate N-acetyltransferase
MNKRLVAIVLAAGEGTRFHSETAKVLHPLLGKSLLRLAVEAARGTNPDRLLVVAGRRRDGVAAAARALGAEVVEQTAVDGTARAMAAAKSALRNEGESQLLILPAGLPLIRSEILRELLTYHRRRRASLTVLSALVSDPRGFGRVVRGQNGSLRIVEERDAEGLVLAIREVGTSIYAARAADLLGVLPRIRKTNAAGEAALTDAVGLLAKAGRRVEAFMTPAPEEIIQVHTRVEAALAGAALRDRKNRELAEAGVAIVDPSSAWIDLEARIGRDSIVSPFVVIEGATTIGRRSRIGPGCHVRDAVIGDDVVLSAATVIEEAVVENAVTIGPFARLRGGTVLRAGAHVGNFVEMKKTDFGPGAKAGHLSYLGDSDVGEGVNIGAGTITCNFDGVRKNRTVIEAGAFIGSGSELVAPIRIGRGAYVAAGSVIVEDVAPDALAIARGRQSEKPGWARRKREERARQTGK